MSLQTARLRHAGGQRLYLLPKSRVLMRVQAGAHCLSTGSPIMKWSLPREGVWLVVHSLFASLSDPYTSSDNLFFTHSKSRTAAPARDLSCVGVWVILRISFGNFLFYISPGMIFSRPACKGLSLAFFIFCSCPSTKSAPKNFLEHAVPGSVYHVERLGGRDILTGRWEGVGEA